tara:strand:- start:13973 stop:14290 length:318 start_codon:yes stop_codon:yes gene_type:complete
MKIRNTEDKVKAMLQKHPETRDNDQKLVSFVWAYFIGFDRCKEMTAWELLTMISRKELPNIVSIWRCRQKLQEHLPELRGEKWEERQKHSKKTKEEIKEWKPTLF